MAGLSAAKSDWEVVSNLAARAFENEVITPLPFGALEEVNIHSRRGKPYNSGAFATTRHKHNMKESIPSPCRPGAPFSPSCFRSARCHRRKIGKKNSSAMMRSLVVVNLLTIVILSAATTYEWTRTDLILRVEATQGDGKPLHGHRRRGLGMAEPAPEVDSAARRLMESSERQLADLGGLFE